MLEHVLAVQAADRTRFLIALPAEGSLLIGREAPADVVVSDTFMSRSHVRIDCNAARIFFTDGDSRNGTLVNGVRAKRGTLQHGDCFLAGRSFFRLSVVLEGKVASPLVFGPPPTPLLPEQRPVLTAMAECAFAVLDGAISPAVYEFIQRSGAFFQSLYEGEPAIPIAPMGPFLVDLSANPDLLPHLVQLGWNNAWGVFLKSSAGFEQVRHHLRTLLLTQAEDGRTLLFRFYDPRVLVFFVATCTPKEREELFGYIEAFLLLREKTGSPTWLMPSGERVALSAKAHA